MKFLTAIQQPYIKLINLLEPLSGRLSERLGEKRKSFITEELLGLIMFFPLYDWTFEYTSLPDLDRVRPVLMLVLFCAVIFFGIKGKVKPVRLKPAAAVIYILYTAAMIAALIIKISDPEFETVTKSLMFLAVLPMLFIVWANRGDYERLFTMAARPFACMTVLYCAALTVVGSWVKINGEFRFQGTTTHPNGLAIILLTGFVCCAFLLLAEKPSVFTAIYGIGICLEGFFLMLTASRTSFLTAVAAAAAVFVYAAAKKEKRKAGIIAIICAVLILSFCAARPYYTGKVEAILSERIYAVEIEAEQAQEQDELAEKVSAEMQGQSELREDRFSIAGKDLNLILNGRPGIWKAYVSNLSFFGENAEQRTALMSEQLPFDAAHAHNYFIQTAFDYGAVAGALCLLTAAAGLVYCAVCVFKRSEFAAHRAFSILMICAFFIAAIPEIIGKPLGANISILYALALLPMFDGENFSKRIK